MISEVTSSKLNFFLIVLEVAVLNMASISAH